MSDHAQLAKTGSTLGGVVVIGGVAYSGFMLLAIGLVVVGAIAIGLRLGFRRNRNASQR